MREVSISALPPPNGAIDHLDTQHLRLTIRVRSMWGALAAASGRGGLLVITFVYNAVLARLISPHDFGLVAMAMVVGGFLQVFKDAGLSTATIQREDITNAQVSNLFWINLAVGGAAMLGMAMTAPMVARFFHERELVNITLVMSFGFVLEALAVQHLAILNRQMRFTLISGLDLGCAAAGFLVGILMALGGWGYWSLVGATLSTSVFRVSVVWAVSGWRPQRPLRNSGTRPLVRFGADLTLVGVVYALSRGCDSLLIGRYIGSDAVGLYSRATALLTRPLELAMGPVYTVIVPALSRLQSESERYRRSFLQVFEGLAIGAFVLAGLLFPMANPMVSVILGDQWRAAGPIFQALTIAFIYLPLAIATSWLYTSQGRGRDLLVSACVGAAIMVGGFLVGLRFGTTGVAIGYSTSNLLGVLPVTFYMAGRSGPVTTRDLYVAGMSHVPVFAVVLATTWLARESIVPTAAPFVQLVVCLMLGTVAGVATLWALPRSRSAVLGIIAQLNDLRGNRVEA
jgi:PST family polysaccharide transporter